MTMAIQGPQFSPAGGVGSTVDYAGQKWLYGEGGWTPIQTLNINQSQPGWTNLLPGMLTPSNYQPGQQPQQQQQSSGTDWSNPANWGYDVNGMHFQTPQDYQNWLAQQNAGPSEAEMQQMVDAQYAPAANQLNFLEEEYNAQHQRGQEQMQTQYQQALPPIEQAQTAALGDIEQQRSKGKRQERSEIAKARNLYQELLQSATQRFGGSSSAAMAAQELLGRDVARQLGSVREGYGDFYKNLESEAGRIKEFYTNKQIELKQNLDQALNGLRSEFESKIREINMQRNTLEANKSYAKLQMLQQYSQQVQAAQLQTQQMAQQLEQWFSMKDQLINEARSMGAKSITVPGIPNVLGNYSMSFGSTGGGGGSTYPSENEIQGYINTASQYPGASLTTKLNPYTTLSYKPQTSLLDMIAEE